MKRAIPLVLVVSVVLSTVTLFSIGSQVGTVGATPSLLYSDNEVNSTTSNTYIIAKSWTDSTAPGTLQISFDLKSGGGNAYGRIYKNNDNAVGTERSTNNQSIYTTYTENISGWTEGDNVQLKFYNGNGSPTYVRNFEIYGNLAYAVSLSTDNASKIGTSGMVLTYPITVHNTGLYDDNYTLTISDNAGWNPSFTTSGDTYMSPILYASPTDPAIVGNWGNRTHVIRVSAENSSAGDIENTDPLYRCTGSNDQEQINDAIDNLYYTYGGGKVLLSNGVYIIGIGDGSVNYRGVRISAYRSNISLVGASQSGVILLENSSPYNVLNVALTTENVLVENLTVIALSTTMSGHDWQADTTELSGIIFTGKNNVVKNVTVENASAIGIYSEMGSISDSHTYHDLWVENCHVENTQDEGIWFDYVDNIYVIGNTVINGGVGGSRYTGSSGIGAWRALNGVIANNTVTRTGQVGITMDRMGALIQGNLVTNSGVVVAGNGSGIAVSDNNNIVFGNEIEQNKYGVYLTSTTNNCIVDNNNFVRVSIPTFDNGTNNIVENNQLSNQFYSSSVIFLASDNSANVTVQVTIPDNAIGTDNITFSASGTGDNAVLYLLAQVVSKPIMSTLPASSITDTSAVLNFDFEGGYENGVAPYFDVYYKYSYNSDLQYPYIVVEDNVNNGLSPSDNYSGSFTISELNTNTVYYYIAIAKVYDNGTLIDTINGIPVENFRATMIYNYTPTVFTPFSVSGSVTTSKELSRTTSQTFLIGAIVITSTEVMTNAAYTRALSQGFSIGVSISATSEIYTPPPPVNYSYTRSASQGFAISGTVQKIVDVYTPLAVSVSISPSSKSGESGWTLSYTVTITNTGDNTDNYDLTVVDTRGWTISLSDNLLVNLAHGENQTIAENVVLGASGSDTITTTATSRTNNSIHTSAISTATVTEASGGGGGGTTPITPTHTPISEIPVGAVVLIVIIVVILMIIILR